METSFSIDSLTGNILMDGVVLYPLEDQNNCMKKIERFGPISPFGKHGALLGVTVDKAPAYLNLMFVDFKLDGLDLNVNMFERFGIGFPTREQAEEEVAFVRKALFSDFDIQPNDQRAVRRWGEVWSYYDKFPLAGGTGIPSHGIKYRA